MSPIIKSKKIIHLSQTLSCIINNKLSRMSTKDIMNAYVSMCYSNETMRIC